MKIKKCKKCGSKNIKLWDCGYSSLNLGGGECAECGYKVSSDAGSLPTQEGLTAIWNRGQLPTELEKLQAENKKLRRLLRFVQSL